MALPLSSNFDLNARIFLDTRQIKESYSDLVANESETLYPPGFEVYCKLEKKWYQNTADEGLAPAWIERPSGTTNETISADDIAIIDDINITPTTTYSNYKIENRMSELSASTTQVSDDLNDVDTRVAYLEGKQLEINSFKGSYDSLTGKPTIPTATSQLINDSGFVTESTLNTMISFNESGELVVVINGVSRTFVPKSE